MGNKTCKFELSRAVKEYNSTHVYKISHLFNKERSLSRVLHCDKTLHAFENTRRRRVCLECFITGVIHSLFVL